MQFIVRLSPLKLDSLKVLELRDNGSIDSLLQHIALKGDLKTLALDELHEIIGKTSNYEAKMELIRIKRNIFNDRHLVYEEAIERYEALDEYLDTIKRIKELHETIAATFEEENPRIFAGFHLLIQDPRFLKGLVLSTPQLFDHAISPLPGFRRSSKRIQCSLLKYLSRMVYKTSPFSQFTHLANGRLSNEPSEGIEILTGPGKSIYSVNTILFGLFVELLRSHGHLSPHLVLELNSSIYEFEGTYKFIVLRNDSENLVSMAKNGLVHLVIDLLSNNNLNRQELLNHLSPNVDADVEDLNIFLDSLVESGLLLPIIPINPFETESWVRDLILFLSTLRDRDQISIDDVIQNLHSLQESFQELPTATPSQRFGIVQRAKLITDSIIDSLTIETALRDKYKRYVPATRIFYEDCFSELSFKIGLPLLSDKIESMRKFCQLALLVDDTRTKKAHLTSFYLSRIGKNRVPFIEFYSVYFDKENNQLYKKELQVKTEAWNQHIQLRVKEVIENDLRKSSDSVTIIDVEKVLESLVELDERNEATSLSAYFQHFLDSDDGPGIVVNTLYFGFGKTISRFLHGMDPALSGQLRSENQMAMTSTMRYVECPDMSYSLLNKHPELLEHEIDFPDGYHNYKKSKRIKLSDIEVGVNPATGQLCMFEKLSSLEIQILDLGMQSSYGRTKLYELLQEFTGFQKPYFGTLISIIDSIVRGKHNATSSRVVFTPRVRTPSNLVIRRMRWQVPIGMIPLRKNQETDLEYYLRVRGFLKSLLIPLEFFLTLTTKAEGDKKETNQNNLKKRKADHKPQYINAKSMLFIDLFSSLLDAKDIQVVHFEEVLPNSSGGKESDFAREYQIQLTVPVSNLAQHSQSSDL